MSQWPLVDLLQLTDSSIIPWWLLAPQGTWHGCRAQCNPLGPGTTAPAGPGLGLRPGSGPGPGPGHNAIHSPLSYWLSLLAVVPASYSLAYFPSVHRAPQKLAIYFPYGFLWRKGRKPSSPVHLLYLMCFSGGTTGRKLRLLPDGYSVSLLLYQ